MTNAPPLSPPTDTAVRPALDVLPKTLGKTIQKGLKLIASEVQELAEDLRLGLRQYERELLSAGLHASGRRRARPPTAALDALPDRWDRRIKRLSLVAEEIKTLVRDLAESLKSRLASCRQPGPRNEVLKKDLRTGVQEYERELVIAALEASDMSQAMAAKALGVRPTTLSEKVKRFGLRRSARTRPEKDSNEMARRQKRTQNEGIK